MIPERVLVRLGELTLKGRNRKRFEKAVLYHMNRVLASFPELEYQLEFGRIHIQLNGAPYEEIVEPLRKVFGIVSFSPVYSAPLNLAEIEDAAVRLMTSLNPAPDTFKVTVRRANKQFEYDTRQLCGLIGGTVLRAMPALKVDVHQPQTVLHIEIRKEETLLFNEVEPAAGGFPQGSNGKGLLLLSGGIDSPVAGYLALRQGLELEAVHFHSFPYTSERSQEKVKDLARQLAVYAGPVRLHMVPLTELQTKLNQAYKDSLYVTLLRRAMMRIAGKLADRHGAGALVTGESLGQVASQTLPSMNAIGRVVQLPIIRPLVCMEKKEIMRMAEEIGTYSISIQPYEDCCTIFLPPKPSTSPNINIVEMLERKYSWLEEAVEQAVEGTETVMVDRLESERKQDALSSFF